jgi:hypothetical protein
MTHFTTFNAIFLNYGILLISFEIVCVGIMVRIWRVSRHQCVGGIGMPPPITSTLEGYAT